MIGEASSRTRRDRLTGGLVDMLEKCLSGLALATAAVALLSSVAHAERGRDGQLRILYWQAVSTVNPYLSGGTKDIEAASLVLEPLARYDDSGTMVPALAAAIPTVENGGVAADLRSITWTLKQGVIWSDGTPFTAADVAFSAAYCLNEEMGCNPISSFSDVSGIEALDDRTVRIDFGVAKPFPYGPFVGSNAPILQKAQFEACTGARAQTCTAQNFGPIGTGPFKVDEFRANDVIVLSANERYREPGKPAFASVTFKGGGDAASAARAVLATGEFDYAWNLQIEPEVLEQMVAQGKGTVVAGFGTMVERRGDMRSRVRFPSHLERITQMIEPDSSACLCGGERNYRDGAATESRTTSSHSSFVTAKVLPCPVCACLSCSTTQSPIALCGSIKVVSCGKRWREISSSS